jgi:transglutaminase-like putative cysteine protease
MRLVLSAPPVRSADAGDLRGPQSFSLLFVPTTVTLSRWRAFGYARILAAVVPGWMVASPVAAQGSNVRPAKSDSIYRLAVDSAAYKDYPFVYLLDDGIVHFETDGRAVERYHQIVQILKTDGVDAWAERQFSYQPGHTKVTVNTMRVVRASGEVISDKPSISQASDVPASMSNPIYSDTKVLRYSLAGVAVGTLVDIDWTQETTQPFLAGDFTSAWSTTMAYPAMRSRYVLDVPASVTPRLEERHVDVKRVEEQAGGRHYYVWAKQQVTPVKGEIFAPDSVIPRMSIGVAAPIKWGDIGRWYGGLAADRYTLSPRTTAIVDSIARLQHSADDTLQALHTWIARDIRYVSVALGLGGYQPRFPDSTVASGFGDCKDKATLFIAAAKHVGLTAYPVLLNSSGAADSTMPSVGEFDHAIAALPNKGGGYKYLDLTTNEYPAGTVPPSYQGGFGLVVFPDGKSEPITFPKDRPGETITRFEGTVGADGSLSGRLELTFRGSAGSFLRAGLREAPDSGQRAQLSKLFGSFLPGSTVDTLILFDARDPRAEPKISLNLHGADGFKNAGSLSVLTVPAAFYAPAAGASGVLRALADAGPRRYPIDAGSVFRATAVTELVLTLPEGWKVELPKGVAAKSEFGDFQSQYSQDSRVLRMQMRIVGAEGVFPKERLADLETWLKALTNGTVKSLVARPPAAP